MGVKTNGQTIENSFAPQATRSLTLVRSSLVGNTLTVGFVLSTDGTKAAANAFNADIIYDPAVLSNPTSVRAAPGANGTGGAGSGGTTANAQGNPIAANQFRVLVDLPGGQTFGLAAQTVVLVDFTVVANPPQMMQLSLTNIFVAGVTGVSLPTTTSTATILIGPMVAAGEIGGRILAINGRGISRSEVTITNQRGETKTTTTNSFGYFRFDDVSAGETYVITARRKGYEFVPQFINFSENIVGLIITADDPKP